MCWNAWCWVLGSWVFVPVFHAHSTPIVSLSSSVLSVLVSLFCVPTVPVTLFSVCLHISVLFSFYSSTWKVSLLCPVLLSIFFPSLFLPVADWRTSPLFLAVCHHVISSQCMYTPTFLFVMASVFLPSFVPMVFYMCFHPPCVTVWSFLYFVQFFSSQINCSLSVTSPAFDFCLSVLSTLSRDKISVLHFMFP